MEANKPQFATPETGRVIFSREWHDQYAVRTTWGCKYTVKRVESGLWGIFPLDYSSKHGTTYILDCVQEVSSIAKAKAFIFSVPLEYDA